MGDMGPEAKKAAREIAARHGTTFEYLMNLKEKWHPLPQARREFYVFLRNGGVEYSRIARWMGLKDCGSIRVSVRRGSRPAVQPSRP